MVGNYQFKLISASVGHYWLRRILNDRPSVEKLIVSNTMIPISLVLEFNAYLGMIAVCAKVLVPELMEKLMLEFPNAFCGFSSLGNYLTYIPLFVLLFVLICFRSLRSHHPSVYIGLNHERLTLCLYVCVPIISLFSAIIQQFSCSHLCR